MWVFSPLSPWQRIRSFDGTADVIRVHKASNVFSILCPKGVSKGFSPHRKVKVSPCVSTEYLPSIYRVSTEYLHSIRQYVSTTPHRHNPGPDSDSTQLLETILSPQSPTPGQCPQAEALLSEKHFGHVPRTIKYQVYNCLNTCNS